LDRLLHELPQRPISGEEGDGCPLSANPPRWIILEDGRERWWAGLSWTDDYKVEPEEVVVAITSEAAAAPTAADEIKKLGDLHTAGILTDDEFSAAKKKLLGI